MRFLFENNVLDGDRRELTCAGTTVPLQPQVFDLLLYLVAERARVVSKDDLISRIWSDRIVSDSALNSRINAARKALGDDGTTQRLIKTIPRKGFRFVGDVRAEAAAKPAPAEAALSSPRVVADRPGIAVLAFENMSGDPAQDYFGDGISEDILTALSKQRWFIVIARNSSFTYKGRAVHIKQIAEELGVRYVVEGSVRKVDNRVRITAQLNDATTGGHLWAERYDRELVDVFAVQDEITERIVAAIEPQIHAAENFRTHRKPPASLDAWDLLMQALSHYWRITPQDHAVAQKLLERAIGIDPDYGQALAVLAASHMFGVHLGWAELATTAPIAENAALAAMRCDHENAWAHAALGSVCFSTSRLAEALSEFEQALALNPNFSLAQGYYALALSYAGRSGDSFEAAQKAIRLSPRDPSLAIYYGIAGYARFTERRYDEAIALAREAIRHRGDLTGAYRVLAVSAGMTGDSALADMALGELRRTQPNISLDWIATQLPWVKDADREHYLEGFRRAGLS
ncbi:winged helix-turn-helix domain-containing tetratricopeptide repeat protein [Bradyrhizobium arachidis]|uniref:winged helix-turn-helix domain-containing tetratricopeptide repeat protein n=1 Tax=Bradyrhizobium TaxID=374 RepID=UPI002163F2D4|nr:MULTISPECIES: winged helix-turn-helix domain-containing tetratricopeptide repeat protein [Bradyrhizobium]MDN4984391.1 winged helix-turn-helix domain-containing tetratricopeptide repeat protein [Bradyrhizobium sp. WYCCWR 13022]UVO36521.1 winged helix-turn-helix domain-containing tetratricopeptide repeat protein [Bradyrhizobium arachidis]